MNKRKSYLDAIRILACFLVIVNHTNSRIFLSCDPSATWFASLTYFFVSKTAVPLFLLVSGAVLLNRCDGYKKGMERFWRILTALVVFSFVYYLRDCIVNVTPIDIRGFALSIYQTNITNSFWYLYLYLAIIIMLPLLQKMFSAFDNKDIVFLCVISLVVCGAFPIVKHYIPLISESVSLHLPVFSAYIGLMAAGHYFANIREPKKNDVPLAVILLVVCIALCVVGTYYEYKADSSWYLFFDDRTSILITVPAMCIFVLFRRFFETRTVSERTCRGITYFAGLTFGTYLLSDLAIDLTEPLFDSLASTIPSMIAMPLWEIVVFLMGLAVTSLLIRIPYFKKML